MGYLSYQLAGDLSIKSTPSKIDLVGESGRNPFLVIIIYIHIYHIKYICNLNEHLDLLQDKMLPNGDSITLESKQMDLK